MLSRFERHQATSYGAAAVPSKTICRQTLTTPDGRERHRRFYLAVLLSDRLPPRCGRLARGQVCAALACGGTATLGREATLPRSGLLFLVDGNPHRVSTPSILQGFWGHPCREFSFRAALGSQPQLCRSRYWVLTANLRTLRMSPLPVASVTSGSTRRLVSVLTLIPKEQ